MTRGVDAADLRGKTVVVTGGTSGIGRAIAERLAECNACVVVLARDPGRGAVIREAVSRRAGHGDVEVVSCDLARLSSVRDAAARILSQHATLDALVNNAGLISGERVITEDGRGSAEAGGRLSPSAPSSPEEGADTPAWLASSPSVERVTGGYFHRRRPKASSRTSCDEQAQERLWRVSAELTGIGLSIP